MFDIRKLGMQIAELRKEKNMTQVELADKMEVSFQAVSNWERGNSAPDISKLTQLAEVLCVSTDYLLGGTGALISHVLENKAGEFIRDNEIDMGQVMSITPLLKPSQYEQVFENTRGDITPDELCGIAPFVSREVMDKLAGQIESLEEIGELCGIAPFVSREVMDKLAGQIESVEEIGELCGIAPFVSKEALDALIQRTKK